MRRVLLIGIFALMGAALLGIAQSAIVANTRPASRTLLPVSDKLLPSTPRDSGPPGADEIQYDSGRSNGWWHYLDRRTRYAVRMDPAYHPAIVVQCDVCVKGDFWPPHAESVYVQIWFDRNGDGMPDFPAVWSAWAQMSAGAPDTTAVTVPVPFGQVVCDSGSFWVGMMMDTVHEGVNYLMARDDDMMNYPDHQAIYCPAGDTWGHWDESDFMIRSWTCAFARDVSAQILVPNGRFWEGDSIYPRVVVQNLGQSQFDGWIWMRIQRTRSTDCYVDSDWIHLAALETKDTSFRLWVAGSRGLYRIQCTAECNDSNWMYFTVLPRAGLEEGELPQSFDLNGIEVGPSQVRSEAVIRYGVTDKSRVKLRILDTRGRVVRTLVAGCSSPGEHLAVWDARDDQGRPAARGIYFVRLESQDCQETRKVVLTR